MNIFFKYNKNETKFEEKIIELKEYIEKNGNIYNIKILSKSTSKSKCDLYIILSDKKDEIYKYLDKLEDKEKILIITSNITTSHILECVNITNNVTYLGNKSEVILNRIKSINDKNK